MSSASSFRPATLRLWYSAAQSSARRSAGKDGRARPARAFSDRTSGERSNMLATLTRTLASSSAGIACRSAESANRFPSSARPAAKSDTTRWATSGPRRGWRSGVRSSAFAASSAAAAGSEAPRTWAALSAVSIATSSPGSALSTSWVATSTGSAPRASSTSAACRSIARRTGDSKLPRTASRMMSCRNANRPPSSAKISA